MHRFTTITTNNMQPGQLLPAQNCPTQTCLSNDRMMVVTIAAEMLDILTKVATAGEL